MDAPSCYKCAAWAERKSILQGSGLVRTVGPCAQRRVALMPQRGGRKRERERERERKRNTCSIVLGSWGKRGLIM